MTSIKTEADSLELELRGGIFIVERDKEGEIISEEELDGQLILKVIDKAVLLGLTKVAGEEK